MTWHKLGKIFDASTFKLSWFKRMAMVPVPMKMRDNRIRLYCTFCDQNNVGRIGYVDINSDNPLEVVGVSQNPIVDIGEPGAFDDNGVVTASLFIEGNKIYLFYSGYQLTYGPPYMIFTGMAVSVDGGESFEKVTKDVPLLDRVRGEFSTRCVPNIIKENNLYRMWYAADTGKRWIKEGNKFKPEYCLKYLESYKLDEWPLNQGVISVPLADDGDEHGITKCTIRKIGDVYEIYYSIRSRSQGYRIGYGQSKDGKVFQRQDHRTGITVSDDGFDSEMVAFPEVIDVGSAQYMFYCGNDYGLSGIGVAKKENE